jgi:hypothetical protein
MGGRIKASQLSEAAQDLADDIGPYARGIAKQLGLDFSTLTDEQASTVRAAQKDPEIMDRVRAAIGAKPSVPAAPSDDSNKALVPVRSPAAVKSALAADAPAVDAEYIPPPSGGGMGALPPGKAAGLLEGSKDLVPAKPNIPAAIPKAASANAATPEELDAAKSNFPKRAAAGAALAAGAGGAALLSGKKDEAPAPAPDAAKVDEDQPSAGPDVSKVVKPSGQVDPGFVTQLAPYVDRPYDGPPPPGLKDTVVMDGKEVRPVDLMAQAQRDLVAATNRLADDYRQERDSVKQQQLFEGIANALGHLAAGWYGAHAGVDMSGTKFDVTDWVARQRELTEHYNSLSAAEEKKYGAAEKTAQTAERSLEQDWNRNAKLYEMGLAQWNAQREGDFRQWQSGYHVAELKNQVAHYKQENELRLNELAASIDKANDANAVKLLVKQQTALQNAQKWGEQAQTLVARAVAAKNADAGMVLLNQAKELNDKAGAVTGKPPIDPSAFIDPRGNNSIFGLGFIGKDKPGPVSPAQVAKNIAKGSIKKDSDEPPAPAAAAVAPPPAGTVHMKDPKTGKLGWVPAANVASAKASGLVEVP